MGVGVGVGVGVVVGVGVGVVVGVGVGVRVGGSVFCGSVGVYLSHTISFSFCLPPDMHTLENGV